jgi:hypothetical protein
VDDFPLSLAAGSYVRYLKSNSREWIEVVQSLLPPAERTAAVATLLVAVFDGLFLELISTGDRRRTGDALDEFIRIIAGSAGALPTLLYLWRRNIWVNMIAHFIVDAAAFLA